MSEDRVGPTDESQDAAGAPYNVQVPYKEYEEEGAADEDDDGPPPLVEPTSSMTFTFNTDMTPYEGGLQQTPRFPHPSPVVSGASLAQFSTHEVTPLYTDDAFVGGGRTNRRRAQDPDYIPRAPNAFILFRASFVRTYTLEGGAGGKKDRLGKLVGEAWRALPAHERAEWEAKAILAQEEHRRRYPDWRFKPQQIAAGLGQPSGPRPRKGRIKDGGGGNYDKGEGSSKGKQASALSETTDTEDTASSSASVAEVSGPQIVLDQIDTGSPSVEHISITGSSPISARDEEAPGRSRLSTQIPSLLSPPQEETGGRLRSRSLATKTRSQSTASRRGRGRSVELGGPSRPAARLPESPRREKRSAMVAELLAPGQHSGGRGRNTDVSPPRKKQDKGKGREQSTSGGIFRHVPATPVEQHEHLQSDSAQGPPSTPESAFSSPILAEAKATTGPSQAFGAAPQGSLNIRFYHDPRSVANRQAKPQKGPSEMPPTRAGALQHFGAPSQISGRDHGRVGADLAYAKSPDASPYFAPADMQRLPAPPVAPHTPVMSPATTAASPFTSPATSLASPHARPAAGFERHGMGIVPLTEMFKRSSSAPPMDKGPSPSIVQIPDFIARREEEEESDDAGGSSGSTTPQNVVRPTPPGSSGISVPFGVGKVGQPGVGWSISGSMFTAATSEASSLGTRPTHGRRDTISLPIQRASPVEHQQYTYTPSVEPALLQHPQPTITSQTSSFTSTYQDLPQTAQTSNESQVDVPSQQNWAPLTTEGMGYECSDWQARPLYLRRRRPQLTLAQPYHHTEDTSGIQWTRETGRQGVLAAIEAPQIHNKWSSGYDEAAFAETADWTTQASPELPLMSLPVPHQHANEQQQQQPVEFPATYGTSSEWSYADWTPQEPAPPAYSPAMYTPQQTTWPQQSSWNQQPVYYPQHYLHPSPYTQSQQSPYSQPQSSQYSPYAQAQHSPYTHSQQSPYAQPGHLSIHPEHSPYAQPQHLSAQISPLASPAMKGFSPPEQTGGGPWPGTGGDLSGPVTGVHGAMAEPAQQWASYRTSGWGDPPAEERR
ncbi:hypothetical protein BD626DRAFT_565011 [Schizophyllum amplum]|uniref:HMG box domain-containing protein n=1 Tax=Schizophyllum amplum TaxID=97359 RepID=A0A550CTP1_9AGAR|nr:hypothetical protein BD626DRAFT_565011 [Auriculariopsis ampla]